MAESTETELPEPDDFFEQYEKDLIHKVTRIPQIVDALIHDKLLDEKSYHEIMAMSTTVARMRVLLKSPFMNFKEGKKRFMQVLQQHEPYLLADLRPHRYNIAKNIKTDLVEKLKKLTFEELDEFKFLIGLEKGFEDYSMTELKQLEKVEDVAELIILHEHTGCMSVADSILRKMNKSHLIWSSASKGTKVKHPAGEKRPPLIPRETMLAFSITLLLETIADLNDKELRVFVMHFKNHVQHHKRHSYIRWSHLMRVDLLDIVFLMVQIFGHDCVEITKGIVKMMSRTDLVLKLMDTSVGATKKPSVDAYLSELVHKVATMVVVEEMLLETLDQLNSVDLDHFKRCLQLVCFQKRFPHIPWKAIHKANRLVEVMVDVCGQSSVEVTNDILKMINRTDLEQRLSEISSGLKVLGTSAEVSGATTIEGEEDERCSVLIQEEQMMVSVIKLALETLAVLSDQELRFFKRCLVRQIHSFQPSSQIPWRLLRAANLQETVIFIVQTYGRESVEKSKAILEEMKGMNLLQGLSDTKSEPTEKFSEDKHSSALIQKVATMVAVKHLLLENLNELKSEELEKFMKIILGIPPPWGAFDNSWVSSSIEDKRDMVNKTMEIFGQHSVEVAKKVFMNINRTDLVQKLSETCSRPKEERRGDEYRTALFQRVAKKESVKKFLLETLNSWNYRSVIQFLWLLRFTYFQKSLPQTLFSQLMRGEQADMVEELVSRFGQSSVEVFTEVFKDMNMTDLCQTLLDTTSIHTQEMTLLLQKDPTMAPIKEKLLETLEDLTYRELNKFKSALQTIEKTRSRPEIPKLEMQMVDRVAIVEWMVQMFGEQSVKVAIDVVRNIDSDDLEQGLSDLTIEYKGASRSSELEGCGGTLESSKWIKLEPEVTRSDADKPPTYCLQSEAGSFECSVSALRWVCTEKVSFQFQFCSWGGHMERIASLQYIPAGPLMNVTVNAGTLDEVYLPHWICIDDDPTLLDKFAVLHIDDCGDVVEKVSEVTPSHIKLPEAVFSLKAPMIKSFLALKTRCYMLIYCKLMSSLKLHIYLIPKDEGLKQTVHDVETSDRFCYIRASHPNKSLKMKQDFVLTADNKTAKIRPKELTLRYESDPNFYRVLIEDPKGNVCLRLLNAATKDEVWSCDIGKDDYQSSSYLEESSTEECHAAAGMDLTAAPFSGATGMSPAAEAESTAEEHFVDKHELELINRVSNVDKILDGLHKQQVIDREKYMAIRKMTTSCDQIRAVYDSLQSSIKCKDIFYELVKKHEKFLFEKLEKL
ncbi:uncharacterized protein LOC115044524 isoform X2 [Echeneis naucrates]|uniref:uncharacterized protein LOC115044524 isoform X2 n=1 Tax=Echeneis naucrates TaxID=173247 RepID=UPI001113554C|nr:uncharacterized protein LOC115044524 isoform X2 [Echeneis naucrates]